MPLVAVRLVVCSSLWLVAACGKARIEPDCFMNGLGKGECFFSNRGDAPGTLCGHVVVSRAGRRSAYSVRFCSGEDVYPGTASRFGFVVPGVRDLCMTDEGLWFDACGFTFASSDATGTAAKPRPDDRAKLAEGFAERMCACKSASCVRDAQQALDEVGQHQDQDPARTSPEDAARIGAAKEKLKRCAADAAAP